MLYPRQFRERVVRPTLEVLRLHSRSAENLLLGTAYQESRLRHLHQLHGGPALGLFQIEPCTHEELWRSYLVYRRERAKRVRALAASGPAVDGIRVRFAA